MYLKKIKRYDLCIPFSDADLPSCGYVSHACSRFDTNVIDYDRSLVDYRLSYRIIIFVLHDHFGRHPERCSHERAAFVDGVR